MGREPEPTGPSGTSVVDLSAYAILSLVVGVAVLGLKLIAWQITGSVGLLSDALESTVNIAAAVVALVALRTASRPPDAVHQFGHGKAEYFSALLEGAMILIAATLIVISAIGRLLHPEELERIGIGLAISILASALNGIVAFVLIRVGRRHRSPALVADGQHLLTDIWTTAGVVIAVLAVAVTGWQPLDPLIALAVAANILGVGYRLVRRSASGLMDSALPDDDLLVIKEVLHGHQSPDIVIHGLQTRQSGRRRFVSMHVLVPGSWTVSRGHDLCEEIEMDLSAALPASTIQTHLEPVEDPRAWENMSGAQHPLE